MTADAPDQPRVTVEHSQLAIGMLPLPARQQRGADTLAVAARRAAGSNRGRTDGPA